VGLYDIHTHPQARRQGLASALCERLLMLSASEGAAIAYLQVGMDNTLARRIYQRLGFADGYAYHYRAAP
jgi:ribosomal protein S18 acetylase RimI-like enzyme